MKRMAGVVLAVLLPFTAHAAAESWRFVRSVGGLKVEELQKNATGWLLPVQADVSGLKTITDKPTQLNSGLSCSKVDAVVEQDRIYLTLTTGIAGKSRSATCPAASLGDVKPGAYQVFYRAPGEAAVFLKEVTAAP